MYSESARPHPGRHGSLRGDLQRGQHGDPREAGQQRDRIQQVDPAQQRDAERAPCVGERRHQHQAVGIQAGAQARQHHRPGDRARTDAAQQQAVGPRAGLQVLLHHDGQQGREGAGEGEESRGLHQHRLQHAGLHGIAQAGSKRHAEGFRRQCGGDGNAAPAPQHHGHAEEGQRVDGECPRDAGLCHDQAAQRRSDRARDVHAQRAQRHRGAEHRLGHQFRRGGLLRRHRHRCADAQRECQRYQCPWAQPVQMGKHGERAGDQQHPQLRQDQVAAPVHDVGQRARDDRQQDHRQRGGRLHRRDHQRRVRRLGHDPGGGDVVDPRADVADQDGQPERAERGLPQRGPWAVSRRRGHAQNAKHAQPSAPQNACRSRVGTAWCAAWRWPTWSCACTRHAEPCACAKAARACASVPPW